jgi:hypothetical protein
MIVKSIESRTSLLFRDASGLAKPLCISTIYYPRSITLHTGRMHIQLKETHPGLRNRTPNLGQKRRSTNRDLVEIRPVARSRPSSRFDSDGAYGEYRGEVDILGDETAEGWLISPNYFFPVVVAYCKHVVLDSVLLETLFQ